MFNYLRKNNLALCYTSLKIIFNPNGKVSLLKIFLIIPYHLDLQRWYKFSVHNWTENIYPYPSLESLHNIVCPGVSSWWWNSFSIFKWPKDNANLEYFLSKSYCYPTELFYNVYCPSNTKNFMPIFNNWWSISLLGIKYKEDTSKCLFQDQ